MITSRLSLGSESLVVELASNDGYLLQHFIPKGVPVLGIDPAANVARAAKNAAFRRWSSFSASNSHSGLSATEDMRI